MIVLEINNQTYRVYAAWHEITVKKAREVYSIAIDLPDELDVIYKETSRPEPDNDQIRIYTEQLANKFDELHAYWFKCIEALSDIPLEVLKQTNINDVEVLYKRFVEPFIFGMLYFPINGVDDMSSFTLMGESYFCPESENIMGMDRPFANEVAAVYCDASDVDANCRKQGNKYGMAELITAIVYREKDQPYSDKEALKVADRYKDILTVDIFHSALLQLSKTNSTLQKLFPNLYQKSNGKSASASEKSGLNDFGWLNSIMTVAEMGVLNQADNTPLESVRQTNLYNFMTVLSNLRAGSDFQRIFSEQNKKK